MVDDRFDSLAGIDLESSDRDVRVVAEKPVDRGSVVTTISQGDLNLPNGLGRRHVMHYLRVQWQGNLTATRCQGHHRSCH